MAFYDFDEMLAYSNGAQKTTDIETIRSLLPGCTDVTKTDTKTDKTGVDYIATLRRGAQVLIDAKTRQPGARRWWRDGVPDLALEKWSVIPTEAQPGKTGWTLSEASSVDYVLFTYMPEDCTTVFLYPFQLLRLTFRTNILEWQQTYPLKEQTSAGWKSSCMFVPEPVVWQAMHAIVAQKVTA